MCVRSERRGGGEGGEGKGGRGGREGKGREGEGRERGEGRRVECMQLLWYVTWCTQQNLTWCTHTEGSNVSIDHTQRYQIHSCSIAH